MEEPVIVSACRTPVGKFLGSLASIPAVQLGGIAVAEAIRRSGLSANDVEDVIMGNVLPAGLGQAPARQAALAGGVPPTASALTVNKMCGSGLQAVMLAAQAIKAGDAQIIVAGGMESMSRAPYVLNGARAGWKFGDQELVDTMLRDGLECAIERCGMGKLAEHIAEVHRVSRDDQDAFAVHSHHRAAEAAHAGFFEHEIVPVRVPGKKGDTIVANDEGPRSDCSLEALARLPTVFQANGSVTSGNSSMLSDGGAAVVVTSSQTAKARNLKPMAKIVAYATSGTAPKDLFIAPVAAVRMALEKARLSTRDIDLFELNEAFASQALACARQLELPPDRLNIHGGAIAIGHPLGASGARVLVTLLHALERRREKRGVAALCLGGGNAVAMVVERA